MSEGACDVTPNFGTHAMNTLLQIGNIAQGNLVTMNKLSELDYLENKRMVTLDEAIGAREVASQPPGNQPDGA